MTVKGLCKANGISPYTYYSQLKVVRKELLKREKLPLQQIVPLSISPNVPSSSVQMPVQTQCIESTCVESETVAPSEPAAMQKMIVRKNGMEVEVPSNCPRGLFLRCYKALSSN